MSHNELYRPQFHFSPATGWMNDPNGMVFYRGEYHLFYQYYPDDIDWGPMHWGHAVSSDLVHWEHLPIALAPDDQLGAIFSGSVVVDKHNSSGLFLDEGEGLVALFTHAGKQQQQSLAYSNDQGRTWTKYAGNPVIINTADDAIPDDFRDPKVSWNEGFRTWVMVLAVKDHIEIWTATDLLHWFKNSEFGSRKGCHDGVWECPDLFCLPVQGDSSSHRWVLLASINPGGPNQGGSATQYFIGDLVQEDGRIHFQSDQTTTKWLDYGKDNYAGVTWSNVEGRTLFIGWMSNWQYANKTPTKIWRGVMTMSRELTLIRKAEEFWVSSQPVAGYGKIQQQRLLGVDHLETETPHVIGNDLAVSRIEAVFHSSSLVFGLDLRTMGGTSLKIGFDRQKQQVFVDRRNSGGASFHWALGGIQKAPYPVGTEPVNFTAFLDESSIEVYFGDGTTVVTDLLFPEEKFRELQLISDSADEKVELNVWKLTSIWQSDI